MLATVLSIVRFISKAVGALLIYQSVYAILGFFVTRKYPPAKTNHKYAVLIAARNEAGVIGGLIDSIRAQQYPQELIRVFVAADNCADDTARVAREAGAVVYERRDDARRTKGYALQFLVERIREDFGIDAFEGYFIFDADNLLKADYVARMNEAFDAGDKIITSYRNTKNFGDNWISASYALHWLRSIRTEHRARSVLRLATRVQGTGFLFAAELIKDGWNYTSLTEDRAFSADAVLKGYRIAYNDAAEFYDEQPKNLRVALRQRVRWAKGHLQAFAESGPGLFWGIFVRRSFLCYDMLWIVVPENLLSFIRRILILILSTILVLEGGAGEVLAPLKAYLSALLVTWLGAMFTSAYALFMERGRVARASFIKNAAYCALFPLFDVIGLCAMWVALCSHVEWKPIPHTVDKRISDVERELRARAPEAVSTAPPLRGAQEHNR